VFELIRVLLLKPMGFEDSDDFWFVGWVSYIKYCGVSFVFVVDNGSKHNAALWL
jgi:hypothetical protein